MQSVCDEEEGDEGDRPCLAGGWVYGWAGEVG